MKKSFFSFLAMAILCGTAVFTSCNNDEADATLRTITLSPEGTMLGPGERFQLTVNFFPQIATDREIVWTSSNDAVARVDENGMVTAYDEGEVVITASSKHNLSISSTSTITVTMDVFERKSGSVEGIWEAHSKIFIYDQIWVEEGKSLTIEEGVMVIVQNGQVGQSNAPIEFFVDGSLYLRGTSEHPILFTVPASVRKFENRYEGLWGGFVGSQTFQEMLFYYAIMEFTGALCRAGSPSVLIGMNRADRDRTAGILTDNPDGRVVVMNSVIRYAESDAMYFMGARAIVAHNIIHTIGETDNDGVNLKAGVIADIAFNLTFAINSNGMKLASSGQSPERQQALIRAYNNTIVNSGWRRTKNLKGGSISAARGVSASIFNNLVLNSKLMAITTSLENPTPDSGGGACWSSIVDYNFYASGSQRMTNPNLMTVEGVTIMTAYEGYTLDYEDYYHVDLGIPGMPIFEQNSLIATAPGAPDPGFVNFGFNTVPLDEERFNPAWDFHVTSADSPVFGANGRAPRSNFSDPAFAPFFGTPGNGLMIDGTEFTTPLPRAQYGAFGLR